MRPGDRIFQDHRRYGVVLVVDTSRVLVSWRPQPKAAEWLECDVLELEPVHPQNEDDR